MAGGSNQYGYANGDAVNGSDPFGLKVNTSRLEPAQRAAIERLRASSPQFSAWYEMLDRIPANQYELILQNATGLFIDEVRASGDGYTLPVVGRTQTMLFSTEANWASTMEFEAVVAHEFAHAVAGRDGGTPQECAPLSNKDVREQCATSAQNAVHRDIGLRDRRSYDDLGPFRPDPKDPNTIEPKKP